MIELCYFSRTFDVEFHNFFGTGGHHSHFLLVHLCEVGHIADLGEGLHPLELVRHVQVCPSFPKVGEGGAGVLMTGIKMNPLLLSSLTENQPQIRQTGR